MSFSILPPEIKTEILSYLSVNKLIQTETVSKEWQAIALEILNKKAKHLKKDYNLSNDLNGKHFIKKLKVLNHLPNDILRRIFHIYDLTKLELPITFEKKWLVEVFEDEDDVIDVIRFRINPTDPVDFLYYTKCNVTLQIIKENNDSIKLIIRGKEKFIFKNKKLVSQDYPWRRTKNLEEFIDGFTKTLRCQEEVKFIINNIYVKFKQIG